MSSYADVIYNITDCWVAKLNNDNTYGTPVQIDNIDKVSFDYESDTDTLKSRGMVVEAISIPTMATGEITNGSLDFASMSVLLGYTAGNYSTTPNQYAVMDILLGDEGLPYVGLIVAYASTLGANMFVGFPKFKLDTVPGFDVEQNKFRIGSSKFKAFSPSQTRRAAARYKRNETKAAIPSTASPFLAYFTTPPPSVFS